MQPGRSPLLRGVGSVPAPGAEAPRVENCQVSQAQRQKPGNRLTGHRFSRLLVSLLSHPPRASHFFLAQCHRAWCLTDVLLDSGFTRGGRWVMSVKSRGRGRGGRSQTKRTKRLFCYGNF